MQMLAEGDLEERGLTAQMVHAVPPAIQHS